MKEMARSGAPEYFVNLLIIKPVQQAERKNEVRIGPIALDDIRGLYGSPGMQATLHQPILCDLDRTRSDIDAAVRLCPGCEEGLGEQCGSTAEFQDFEPCYARHQPFTP